MAVTPALRPVRYDPVKDFAAISNVASSPLVLTVNAKLPVTTLAEFVEYARTRPGKVTFGSGGVGTISHLAMALFVKRAGLELIHVPYKGGGPVMLDLIAGQINSTFANLSEALKQADTGNARILAVSTTVRSPQAYGVPTVSESGYEGFNVDSWNGLVAPAGTPNEVINHITVEIAKAAKDPTFIEQLSRGGFTAIGDSPEQFAATIKRDVTLWADVVNTAGLRGVAAE